MLDLIKIYFKDALRGWLYLLVAILIAVPAGIFFLLLPFWEEHRAEYGDWMLWAAFGVWIFIFLGGMAAMVVGVTCRRKAWLDSVFTPLGLTGKPYMLNWWEYRGSLRGRTVIARFYRGPTLEIMLQTSIKTRFGITEASQPGLFLANLAQQKPIHLTNPELQSLAVFALDEAWVNHLLNLPEAAQVVQRLMQTGAAWALIRQVILSPAELKLRLYRNRNLLDYHFSAQEVRAWAEDLLLLAQTAESGPPPVLCAEESQAEKNARNGQTTRLAFWGTIGFFVLLFLCLMLIMLFLVWFES